MPNAPNQPRTSYDEVPYPSHPLPQTHPNHLAALAKLLDLDPPEPVECRILELGCASGGNLIPMALTMPTCQFVGVDMSKEQIGQGQKTVDELGLSNIQLKQLGILDINESFGQFDYIICHGVYSWVPPEVQEKILEVCKLHLGNNGIGYVSFNTNPGWHMRGVIRKMMKFHVGRYPNDLPETQIQRARQLLEFLAKLPANQSNSYNALLQEQLQALSQHSDSYLFHEHLEEHNEPVWFFEFCERLAAHSLRYLADAEFDLMVAETSFSPEVQDELDHWAPQLLEKEQYMDFVRNRSFRQALVCHESQRPDYNIRANRIVGLSVASPLRPKNAHGENLESETSQGEFIGPDGLALSTNKPLVQAAFKILASLWPNAIAFDELVLKSRAQLTEEMGETISSESSVTEHDSQTLGSALLTSFATAGGMVSLTVATATITTTVSKFPVASQLVRIQVRDSGLVTNLRHEVVPLPPFDRHLLPLMDGTRDREALLSGLVGLFETGELKITQEDDTKVDADAAKKILEEVLDRQLPILAKSALLTS